MQTFKARYSKRSNAGQTHQIFNVFMRDYKRLVETILYPRMGRRRGLKAPVYAIARLKASLKTHHKDCFSAGLYLR